MCDPPPDDESHHKGTKNKAIKNTNLPLFFEYFSALHRCPDLCKETFSHGQYRPEVRVGERAPDVQFDGLVVVEELGDVLNLEKTNLRSFRAC